MIVVWKQTFIFCIAKNTNYTIFSVKTKKSLENILKKIQKLKGPILIQISITKSKERSSRVEITPKKIKTRFMNAIK